MTEKQEKILQVNDLSVSFFTEAGTAKAVQNVSFEVNRGETFALVGESGCGKSVTALSILRLISHPGKVVGGDIKFRGDSLYGLSERKMRSIRGNKIAMIFQEPMTSLNPVYTVGDQVAETIMLHQKKTYQQAWMDAAEIFHKVGIPDPDRRVYEYPHQMSGGMRQRVMIAMAVSCNPDLLIADEPTTALDVTIQAQILDLLDHLQKQFGMSILLITHDLGVVAQRADHVSVMYASKIVEKADAKTLFAKPSHPYTQGLLRSIPRLGVSSQRLDTIAGSVPDPLNFPEGCKFNPRCVLGKDDRRCRSVEPGLREIDQGHCGSCWKIEGYETEEEQKEYKSKYDKQQQQQSA